MNNQTCKHVDHWFDREVCYCGTMHYRCVGCGVQMDDCAAGGNL